MPAAAARAAAVAVVLCCLLRPAQGTFGAHHGEQRLPAGVYTLGWRAARSGGDHEAALKGGCPLAGPPHVNIVWRVVQRALGGQM